MQLGWLNPDCVQRRNLYSIAQVETLTKAYWLISRQRTFQEYSSGREPPKTKIRCQAYAEFRTPPVPHIDDSIIEARRPPIGSMPMAVLEMQLAALEQADGSDHLFSGGNSGDADDP